MDQKDLGRRVVEARSVLGLSQGQLAAALGMDRTTLVKIESGKRRVTALELLDFARELGRRPEWFLSTPMDAVLQHRNADDDTSLLPIDIRLEELQQDVDFLREIGTLEAVGQRPILERPRSAEDSEELADQVRQLLGQPDGGITNLPRVAERLDILAFAEPLGEAGADAASVISDAFGIILVNSSWAVGRRRLAMSHELMHIMVDDRFQIDFRTAFHESPRGHEALIERAARAFLAPGDQLRTQWGELMRTGGLREAAVRIGSQLQMDMTTLATRLLELGCVDNDAARRIQGVRTTKVDILEHDLLVPDDLAGVSASSGFLKAVILAYKRDDITADRALQLARALLDADDLPPRPALDPDTLWSVVA